MVSLATGSPSGRFTKPTCPPRHSIASSPTMANGYGRNLHLTRVGCRPGPLLVAAPAGGEVRQPKAHQLNAAPYSRRAHQVVTNSPDEPLVPRRDRVDTSFEDETHVVSNPLRLQGARRLEARKVIAMLNDQDLLGG